MRDDHDPIEGRVGLAVASAEEPVSVRDPGRGGDRTGAAELRERRFGPDACGIVPGDDHHLLRTNPVGVIAEDDQQLSRGERWTPSTGQLINVAKWNLLRYLPVKMRGAEDDQEETAQSFASV